MAGPDLKIEHKLLKNLFPRKWPNWQQIKYLSNFLSAKEKRIIKILGALAIIAALILIIRFFQGNPQFVPAPGGNYIEGVVGSPQYLNPVLAKTNDLDFDLTKLIFSGLFKYNKNLEIVPDLAKNFTISPDKLNYRIELKDNVFWHDGLKLTADDVLYSLEIIQNPQLKNPWSDYLPSSKIKKIDEKTLEFVLDKPIPDFLKYLTIGILPQHVWQNIPLQQFSLTEYNLKPVGSGPFKFKNLSRDKDGAIKSYYLARNDNFYDQKPFLDSITFKFFPDYDKLLSAIQKREVNGVNYLPKYLQENFALTGFLKKYSLELPHYTAIFFNAKNNEFLSSKTIRKVLAYALPKERIIEEVLGGDGQMIDGPILPHSFGYNPEIKKYEYNPAKAAKILENSGWQKNSDGFWQKDNKILEITLTTGQEPDLEKIGEIIQKSWQEIQIKTKLITVPIDSIQKEVVSSRNYQAFIYGIIESFDSDYYSLWHSSQIKPPGLNLSGFANQRVDELLEKARINPFDEVRKKKYFEFQYIISEEMPAIFLYSANYTYLVDKKIKGLTIEKINIPSDRLNGIEEWYIKTKRVTTKK